MDLYVFAGANGSGKSTFINAFYDECNNEKIGCICPDSIAETLISRHPNIYERYIEAMERAEKLRYNALGKRIPICIETVLSTREKIEFILKAKETGYTIHIVYITTISPEINILRVKNRVLQGGHDVPTDKFLIIII